MYQIIGTFTDDNGKGDFTLHRTSKNSRMDYSTFAMSMQTNSFCIDVAKTLPYDTADVSFHNGRLSKGHEQMQWVESDAVWSLFT
ncbi:MAG: hypothetical protein WB799_11340 [Candidatus Sulfotelmatobacter sp.]